MNILVTGANGQLGREMRIVARGSSDRYIFTDVNEVEGLTTTHLDITDLKALRTLVREEGVQVIVNCAAFTNVDGAECDPQAAALAERLNAVAPGYMAAVMKEVGGLLVHISTDYVFGQEPYNTPCREDQQGTPTGVYGATKLRGEQAIFRTSCQHVILRTAWLYSEFGKNFCKTMLQLTATCPQLKVVFDQAGTPTYALDLAKAILVILDDYRHEAGCGAYSKSGIYHYSNEGVCSWYDFTKMIAEYSGHVSCDILPCHSHEFPSPVKRPAYSVLDKTKVKETFAVRVPYWTESLRVCIKNLQDTWK